MTKNEKIKQALKETRARRKNQVCKVYEIKFDYSHLSKAKLEFLTRLFLEAKWFYNYCLNQKDIFKIDLSVTTIDVMNKDKAFEKRELKYFDRRMKEKIKQEIIKNIKILLIKKKQGEKVGKLKFKSFVDSIILSFISRTSIKNKNHIKLPEFKNYFKVIGLDQISENYEIVLTTLIKKNGNYYLKITTYQDKDKQKETNNKIGIDFGIKDDLCFSNDIKLNTNFDFSKTKQQQHKLSRKVRKSKNWFKQKLKLNKSYEHLTNKKEDIKNKIVSYLKNNFDLIAIQDENIKGWQSGLFGKAVQQSILGRTLSKLEKLDKTKVVSGWFPSTKLCYQCGRKNILILADRIYECECGLKEDRDVKSAKTILYEVLNLIPMEHRDFKPVENQTSIEMFKYFQTIPNVSVSHSSMNQEAVSVQ
jgi:putative transposase